ncbi:MAG TPA: AAA family ATPase [bacterium]|nr:AAA family ATPase [bacterium]HPS31799.1 AAA family ATPase [bacterium]
MNPLSSISVKNYKTIRNLDRFRFNNINILLGSNGAGKSNFLSLFRLLNHLTTQNLQDFIGRRGGADAFLFYGTKNSESFSVNIEFETDKGVNSYNFRLSYAAKNSMIFSDEVISFSKKNLPSETAPKYSLGSGHSESKLLLVKENGKIPITSAKTANIVYSTISKWRFFQFHDTSETSGMKKDHYINDCSYLRDDAGNIAPFLFMMKGKYPDNYRKIIRMISKVLPFFKDFILEPLALDNTRTTLDWMETGSDNRFGAFQLSDGALRFIALTTLLCQPEELMPTAVIIDEPELGLHPAALNLFSEMVKSASKFTQIILSTQSSPLINYFEPENIIVVDRIKENGFYCSKFQRLDEEELSIWLENYSLGELWEKNILGGRP